MLYAIVGMLVIILDQGVKFWVTNHIMLNTVTEPLIPGVISLVRMHNDGAAFSFLAGGGARIYFIILTGVFTVAVILMLATNFISGRFGRWCLVLVTAGGLSNCLDRVLYGYVVDMFKVELFDFAVFNVADIFITVFCLLFIIYIIFGGEDKREEEDDFVDDDEFDRPDYRLSRREERERRKEEKAAAALAKREKKRGAKYEEDEDYAARFESRRRAPVEEEAPQRRGARRSDRDELPERGVPSRRSAPQDMEKAPARAPKGKKSRYEEEYEAYLASRPDAKAEMARKSKPASRTSQAENPFAAWDSASAKVGSRQSSTAKAMGVTQSTVPSQPARARRSAEDIFGEETAPARRPAPAREAEAMPERRRAPAPAPAPAPARPAERRPAPAPAPKPTPKADDGMEFDLDDILSEFR